MGNGQIVAASYMSTRQSKRFYALVASLEADGFGVFALVMSTPANRVAVVVNPSYSTPEQRGLAGQLGDAVSHWEKCEQCHTDSPHEP